MRDYSLLKAFIGGHYPTETAADGPGAHLFRNGNDRDKALIFMLDKQLKYRRQEAESIRRTNNANTNLLLNELENGNRELESLRTGISRLEATNYEGFKAICDSMEVTNNLLDDISWRLGQAVSILGDIDFKLGKILNVLKQNRKNEAKQLVNQGARLMLYGDYDGAEERFKLAYNYDVTDYQVLMNLGHVELQKQNAEKAKDWYKKASRLPADIDGYARSLPIWNIARIHYAKGEFEEAYTHAQRASQTHDESLGENIFKVAVYAGLAGHKSECLYGIEGAIYTNPKFFRAAIAHPDLHHIRNDVYRSLDAITNQYNSSIRTKVDKFNSCFNLLKNIDLASVANNALSKAMSIGQSIISNESFFEKWNFYQINDVSVSSKSNDLYRIENERRTTDSEARENLELHTGKIHEHSSKHNFTNMNKRIDSRKSLSGVVGIISFIIFAYFYYSLFIFYSYTDYSNKNIALAPFVFVLCIFLCFATTGAVITLFEKYYILDPKKRLEVTKSNHNQKTREINSKINESKSQRQRGRNLIQKIQAISLEIADELKYPK